MGKGNRRSGASPWGGRPGPCAREPPLLAPQPSTPYTDQSHGSGTGASGSKPACAHGQAPPGNKSSLPNQGQNIRPPNTGSPNTKRAPLLGRPRLQVPGRSQPSMGAASWAWGNWMASTLSTRFRSISMTSKRQPSTSIRSAVAGIRPKTCMSRPPRVWKL